VWNQAGKVAKCQSYSLLEITRESSTRVMIPLVYNENDSRIFSETGPYYVSFDMNIDALTRIVIAEADRVLVSFTDGKGTLDASTLPQALPVPYFTIMGLPRNTARGNFSEVFLYNAAGKIAKCAGYQGIILSRNNESAAAMIPLVYHEAALQFSAFYSNKQINRLIESLYDRDIIYVSHTGYGLIITALKEGDCAMQTLTESGIKDIAVIHVIE
jgi:hypothetical protein